MDPSIRVMITKRLLFVVAQDRKITLPARRVLDLLLVWLDFEKYIPLPPQSMEDILKMSSTQVSQAMQLLEEKGILYQGPNVGGAPIWHLNADFAFQASPFDQSPAGMHWGQMLDKAKARLAKIVGRKRAGWLTSVADSHDPWFSEVREQGKDDRSAFTDDDLDRLVDWLLWKDKTEGFA